MCTDITIYVYTYIYFLIIVYSYIIISFVFLFAYLTNGAIIRAISYENDLADLLWLIPVVSG